MAEDDEKAKKKDKTDDDEDDRLEFILNYLTKSMRMKQEKWNKMIAVEEFKVSFIYSLIRKHALLRVGSPK